jgi:adenosine deaminase
MAFQFRAWSPTEDFGRPGEAVQAFEARLATLDPGARALPKPDIIFEVIDIRPSRMDPAQLLKTLGRLLLHPDFIDRTVGKNSRLLFAGQARSLSDWEPENGVRSINSDVGLFILALRSLDVGHYVCVDPGAGRAGASTGADWITSALFAFRRHYSRDENRNADAAGQLKQLSSDIVELFESARDRKGFERLGIPGNYEGLAEHKDETLLDEIRLLHQLGKRDRLSEHSPEREFERDREQTVEMNLPSTSYDLLGRIEAEVAPWAAKYTLNGTIRAKGEGGKEEIPHPMGATGDEEAAQWLAGATFKMKRYEMLRDLGRLIGSNAVGQLRTRIGEAKAGARATGAPIFLILDDFIYYRLIETRARHGKSGETGKAETPDYTIEAIRRVFDVVGCKAGDFLVIPSAAMPCNCDTLEGDAHLSIFRETMWQPVTLDGEPAAFPAAPETYLAILIDPETTSDALGAVRVQRMAKYLDQIRLRRERDPSRSGTAWKLPSIIAFSQRESSGHVQQCLNLGAAAFTAKHRPYHLLFDLNRALRDIPLERPSTDKASQFRILRSLKPHTTAKLRRTRGPAYFHGGLYCPGEAGRYSLRDFLDDPREEKWIRSLPKADLHCHIGTCIDHATIELMALNTIGYMLGSKQLAGVPEPEGIPAADGATHLLETIARVVALAEDLKRKDAEPPESGGDAPALARLAAAAAAIVQRPAGLPHQPFGMGDAIIEHLRSVDERCGLFQVTAILVATISLHPRRDEDAAPGGGANGALTYLQRLAEQVSGAAVHDSKSPEDFTLRSALDQALERAMNRLREISHRWDGRFTEAQIRGAVRGDTPADQLGNLAEALRDRAAAAELVLKAFLKKAAGDVSPAAKADANAWLEKYGASIEGADPADAGMHPLEPYVLAARAPVRNGRRSGLQLYLQGSDLLGSAHLQYPDNLLLATYAISRDNADDNIIYSEVRCETTGYTRAGMSAVDATEMLRHGFNIASLFLAGTPAADAGSERNRKRPLVRTNILLAAKRHKKEAEARKVVALLETYLERRPADVESALSRLRFPQPFPAWWRPADVVGFDISGDESRNEDWLTRIIEPLEARSSPITIHAGEAADAQSIWHAVYRLNATRIGHGLRLNEDQALLSYCVREGICMEMCPNSNAATNGFRCIPAFDQSPFPLLQYEYPLLQYMRAGMEVSIGTDNRYLHGHGRRDLTSEYIAAARLVGGLTRWEVLQIVKAGFKNAFLAKVEISEMLGAIEETIYKLVVSNAA